MTTATMTKEPKTKKINVKVEKVTPKKRVATAKKLKLTAADKLRQKAENLQKQIDDKKAPRVSNTRRRATMADQIYKDGLRLEKIQKIMFAIAAGMDSGEIRYLRNVKDKTQVETLLQEVKQRRSEFNLSSNDAFTDEIFAKINKPIPTISYHRLNNMARRISDSTYSGGKKLAADRILEEIQLQVLQEYPDQLYSIKVGYIFDEVQKLSTEYKKLGVIEASWVYDQLSPYLRIDKAGITTDEEYRGAISELVSILTGTKKDPEELKERELQKLRQEIAFKSYPGYFPTPKKIVAKMIGEADISEGMMVLEPSAGTGHIAEELAKETNNLEVVEYQYEMREYLSKRGLNVVGEDFFEVTKLYDRIVMNPPFEKGQDITHVMHAYSLLKPGGKVVAIMSGGVFGRQDKQAKAFREFLIEVGGWEEKLPAQSFKESDRSTGVSTRLVVIDK